MPKDGLVHLLRFSKNILGNTCPCFGVEELDRLLLQTVQLYAVLAAQLQLRFQFQILGAVVEDRRMAGQLRVSSPEFGQAHSLLFHPHHMGHPLGADHGVGTGTQLRQRELLEYHRGVIEPMHQNIPIYGRQEVFASLLPAEQFPQLGGRDIHQSRQRNGDHLGPQMLGQVLPLRCKHGLAILLGTAKGADPRQTGDRARVMPVMEGQKHIGPHKQPQLRIGILLVDGLQSIRGVTFPLPVHLQG